jgi:peptidylprolyl isomerase
MRPRALPVLALLAAGLLAGCGSTKPTEPNIGAGAASTTPSTGPSTSAGAQTPKAPTDPRLAKKPVIAKPAGPAPTHLVVKDLIAGKGPAAQASSTVNVQYVGVLYKNAKEFDSSWKRGTPASFPLNGVIKGWGQGMVGMKVGGRRELIIPANLAYGANPPPGSGIGPNEPLVFVIDLLGVQ